MEKLLFLTRLKLKYYIIAVVMVALIVLMAFLLRPPSTTAVYTVGRENLVNTVLANGTFTISQNTPVDTPSTGILTAVYIANGKTVKKGDKLFHVQSTATDDERKTANASYQAALSALQTARNTRQSDDVAMWTKQQAYLSAQNTEKYKNDHTKNPSTGNDYTDIEKFAIDNAVTQTKKDFEAAEEAYKTAGIAVQAAAAKVASTKQAYDETQSVTVAAPVAGKVANLLSQIGDQVDASAVSPVLVIANYGRPVLIASINEVNIARVSVGQKVNITFDGLPGRTFYGRVEGVDSVGTKTQGTVTYSAKILMDSTNPDIKPNMTASVTIETARRDGVLTVPNIAITEKNGGDYVQRQDMKQGSLSKITVGLRGLTKSEVLSGLTEGDKILVPQ